MGRTILHIGVDDTDSEYGMCTTYLAYMMVGMLRGEGATFLDLPRLVRLNPNIPWKTRGNGAVSLKVGTDDAPRLKERIADLVGEHAETARGANPGLVFLEGEDVPGDVARFADLALWRLIPRRDARRFAQRHNLESSTLGNGQGLVGSIAALGYRFGDATAELLSYRRSDRMGTRRRVLASSVRRMHDGIASTFNSYDSRRNRVLITPGGPDPVFYGIRGEDPESLLLAAEMVRADERPAGHLIFKTNQGTGDHLRNRLDLGDIRPYDSGTVSGEVAADPEVGPGGNVFFGVRAGAPVVRCAAYKKSGLAAAASRLAGGDRVIVGGGVRRGARGRPRTLNVEFVRVLGLARSTVPENPACPRCEKRMKSAGRGQGYRCRACGTREQSKVFREAPRRIGTDLYLPDAGSSRHLSRPRQREGRTNSVRFDDGIPWFSVYDNSGE